MSLVSTILDKFGLSASLAQADDFERWLVTEAWNKYNDSRMNKRIIVENEIKNLALRLPNGTVRKDYSASIEIPYGLVEEVWVEGCEDLGLRFAVSNDAISQIESFNETEEDFSSENKTLASETLTVENANDVALLDSTECAVGAGRNVPDSTKYIVTISGKPVQAGDFTLKICFKYKGWINGEAPSAITLPVAFNADPRSLWKNIPTSENVMFYKPDTDCEYVKVEEKDGSGPRKDIVAASQRGRSHAQEGKPRDDHFKLYHCEDSDWYIIAVADGAGSAKCSRQGSKIACETVVNFCKVKLLDCAAFEEKIRAYKNADNEEIARKIMANEIYSIIGNAAFKAHKAIKDAADANDAIKPKDFATTLMFAICKKFDFGWFVASYWVGDGAMCIYNEEKRTIKLLGVPDEGEYSGQTRFLTMPEIFKDATAIMSRLRFSIEDDFTALMLMTDGVSDPMFETDNNLNSFDKWKNFWETIKTGFPDDEIKGVDLSDDNEESKDQLLNWLNFWSPGNHDDRTIAILY